MLGEKIIDKDAIWVDIHMHLDRISYHSKKIGGDIRSFIINKKDIRQKARDLSNKFCSENILEVDQSELKKFLGEFTEIQSHIAIQKIECNQSYSVLNESIENVIRSFQNFLL